ncbi:MAG: hypothetical protein K2X86_00475 [Cytophagaceae bacterium]|nr:hypothetical protein [Cytophagaceae bacterium]
MNKKSNLLLPFLLIAGTTLLMTMYILFIRELIYLAYQGKAPDWFNAIVQNFYPRFIVEKNRFDLAFFLAKADQVIIRFSVITLSGSLLLILYKRSEKLKAKLNLFWNQSSSLQNIRALRVLFFSSLIIIFHDVYFDLIALGKAKVFYKPILPLNFLGIGFPSDSIILILYISFIVSCLLCILNFKPILFSIITILDFILIQAFIFSFEKTDHGFVTFTYAGMILPFLLYEYEKAKQNQSEVKGWPLQLICTCICICYLLTGLEKIFISQLDWLHPDTLRAYLELHQAPLGLKVASNDFICSLLPALVLIFQLGFISILFNKKMKWVFLPAGILFHTGSYMLLNVGGFLNPWILGYLFFIDWGNLPLRKKPHNSDYAFFSFL